MNTAPPVSVKAEYYCLCEILILGWGCSCWVHAMMHQTNVKFANDRKKDVVKWNKSIHQAQGLAAGSPLRHRRPTPKIGVALDLFFKINNVSSTVEDQFWDVTTVFTTRLQTSSWCRPPFARDSPPVTLFRISSVENGWMDGRYDVPLVVEEWFF